MKNSGSMKDKLKIMRLTKYYDPVFHNLKSNNIKKVFSYLEEKRF